MTHTSVRTLLQSWPSASLAVGLLLLLGITPWLMPRAITPDAGAVLQSPSWQQPFGTDELGRNMLARCAVALSLALRGAALALFVAGVLAVALGGMAGWWRGNWIDGLVSWAIGVLHTVPFLLLVAALAAVVQASWSFIYLMAGCVIWAAPARLIRAEVMRIRSSPHARTSRAYGFGTVVLLRRVVAPAAMVPVSLSLLLLFPELLVMDIGLSFFGLGAQPPTPTLGRLLLQGFDKLHSAPWLAGFPLLCVVAACLGLWTLAQGFTKTRHGGQHA